LVELLDVTEDEYLALFSRKNLLPEWPGSSGKGDAFPMADASLSAVALSHVMRDSYLLLLGKNVARAFGLNDVDYFKEVQRDTLTMMVVPHPSGINRWWNEPSNRRLAHRHMKLIGRAARAHHVQ
jgi:hypothetical protein